MHIFAGPGEWREFVTNQIRPLEISEKATFHFLEAGVGVGAFAREILRMVCVYVCACVSACMCLCVGV